MLVGLVMVSLVRLAALAKVSEGKILVAGPGGAAEIGACSSSACFSSQPPS